MSQEIYASPSGELTDKQAKAKADLLSAGDQAFDADEFERALDCYHRASLIDGADPRIWNALGMAYYNLEFTREAWRSYKLALQCDPDNLETLWYAGEFLYNAEDLQLALVILSKYHELESDGEKQEEAEELMIEIRELLNVQGTAPVQLKDPDVDLVEDDDEGEDFEGFEVEGEEPAPDDDEDDEFDDEYHEGDEELELDATETFVASLSLQLTAMDSKCSGCSILIPEDAPYCYSCKAPHFYE